MILPATMDEKYSKGNVENSINTMVISTIQPYSIEQFITFFLGLTPWRVISLMRRLLGNLVHSLVLFIPKL